VLEILEAIFAASSQEILAPAACNPKHDCVMTGTAVELEPWSSYHRPACVAEHETVAPDGGLFRT